jgi:cholesterol oxidase
MPSTNGFSLVASLATTLAYIYARFSLVPFPGADKKWMPFTGVLERVEGNGMNVLCAAAVGGGSIMYNGMTLQPTKANFAASIPMAESLYNELNRWAYPTVARVLGISTGPDDVLNADPYKSSRLFLDVTAKAGMDPFRVPLPIDWRFVPRT